MNKICKILFAVALSAAVVSSAAAASTAVSQSVTIEDSLGRKVTIPAHPERILSFQPEITRILIALGAEGKLVGIDYFLRNSDAVFPIVFPAGLRLPVVSVTGPVGEAVNIETVVRQSADLVFVSPVDIALVENLQKKTGKPVAALASMGRFDNLIKEIELVGRMTDRIARGDELVSYFRDTLSRIGDIVTRIPGEKRPRVYVSFWGKFIHTPVYYEPLIAAGGLNVAEGLLPSQSGTIGAMVSLERIIAWNPDIILVQGNYPPRKRKVTVEGVLADRRMASVAAVKNKKVFYTFGFWQWWDPAEVILETLYLTRLFHPDRLPEFDLLQAGNDVFKKVYGVENVFTAVSDVLKCQEWMRNEK